MHFPVFVIGLLATLAAAQTSTSSVAATSTSCAAEEVFQACLVTENLAVTSCDSVDYNCLCRVAQAALLCYTQCPNASGADTAQTVKDTICSDASYYASATTFSSSSASFTSTPTTTTTPLAISNSTVLVNDMVTSTATSTGTTAQSASTTQASASASATGGAQHLVIGAGGLLAALASFMVIFL